MTYEVRTRFDLEPEPGDDLGPEYIANLVANALRRPLAERGTRPDGGTDGARQTARGEGAYERGDRSADEAESARRKPLAGADGIADNERDGIQSKIEHDRAA